MEWLNYHHLLYFWMTAREGSVARASQQLRLAQPTVSAQIRSLESSLGVKLFKREGRNLVLTPDGQRVFKHAQDIFSIGQELQRSIRSPGAGVAGTPLVVGIDNAVPKRVAQVLLEPALVNGEFRLECREDSPQNLLTRLSSHQLDLVLTDAPLGNMLGGNAFSQQLGSSKVGWFAASEDAARLKKGFPRSLAGAPMLLPAAGLTLRTVLDAWLDNEGIIPTVLAEFDDSALMKAFAHGPRVFPACTAIAPQLKETLGLELVGVVPRLRQDFYAVSLDRHQRHPALARITRAARHALFDNA